MIPQTRGARQFYSSNMKKMITVATLDKGSISDCDKPGSHTYLGRKGGNVLLYE